LLGRLHITAANQRSQTNRKPVADDGFMLRQLLRSQHGSGVVFSFRGPSRCMALATDRGLARFAEPIARGATRIVWKQE